LKPLLSGPVIASPANPAWAGWVIDTGSLLSVGLLENFTINTYSGGMLGVGHMKQDTFGKRYFPTFLALISS
jgi:hypothetical protein